MAWRDRLTEVHDAWRRGLASIDALLDACEPRMRLVVGRRYSRGHHLYDDACQVGRIAAWRACLDWGGGIPLPAHVAHRIKHRVAELRFPRYRLLSVGHELDLRPWPETDRDSAVTLPAGLMDGLPPRYRRAVEARLADPDGDYESLGRALGQKATSAKAVLLGAYVMIRRTYVA